MLSIALLCSVAVAQLPPLAPQSYFAIGTPSWVIPCGPYFVDTQTTAAPWDRIPDTGYPGSPPGVYSCRTGGIFYVRAVQRDAIGCASPSTWAPLGTTNPPLFLFGPRPASAPFVSLPPELAYQGQHYVFDGLGAVLLNPTHFGPWELNSAVDCWACAIVTPNDPALHGTEWAAQAAMFTTASGLWHLGHSRYTRLVP